MVNPGETDRKTGSLLEGITLGEEKGDSHA